MLESFVFSIVEDVLVRVGSCLIQKIGSACGVKGELSEFVKTLSTIKAVLLDAEQQQAKNHQLRDWLGRLNEVCDDAEDMLDEWEYEALRQQVDTHHHHQSSFKTKVRKLFSFSKPELAVRMSRKLQEIRKKLDKIAADRVGFHLIERVEDERVMQMEMETHSFEPPSSIIGRDDEKEKLIQLLICASDRENVSVIPIVGIGGLGKTTLAKFLYNDERVSAHFHKQQIWVSVPADFNMKKMMREIIKSAAGDTNFGDVTLNEMQTLLRNILRDKKYLLVLDNVWNEDLAKWIDLKNLLMDGASGSKIIVTTRSRFVASIVGTTPEHNLEQLTDRDCLTLFVKWAFRQGEEKQYPNLLKIGEEIVKKCGGVPLAVKTLGSLLRLKREVRDWKKIKDSEIWKLEQNENYILAALRLSYIHLPSHLKKCFAFCSIFPKDYKLNSLDLIQLWMAQGLLKSSDENPKLEDIGQQYIRELSWRSFFQNVEGYGDVLTFEMHSLVHDLALSVAQNVSKGSIYFKSDRHVSVLGYPSEGKISLPTQNNLRTIIFRVGGTSCNEYPIKTFISKFKYLRVLDLRYTHFEVLPSSITNLKLLRYLNLSTTSIRKLPRSICQMLNLQTLELSKCLKLEELPTSIGNLINLRCLHITTKQAVLPEEGIGHLKSLRFLGIEQCYNLKSLGEGVEHLTALQTLLIEDCENLEYLPCRMKYLTALETLFIYNCKKLNLWEWEDVQGLSLSLRSLWIARLPQLLALPPWLQAAANTLQHICIGDCCNLTALPEWLQDLKSLQKLAIEDCAGLLALPEGIDSLGALEELKIKNCHKLSKTWKDRLKFDHVVKITVDEESSDGVGTSESIND